MTTPPRKPRILVVSLGRRGGTTKYGWLMSRGLAQQADIAVVSAAAAENRDRWAEIDCPHLEVPTFSSVPTMLLSFFNLARFLRIRRFATEFAPDIVYYPHGHAWKPLLDLLLPRPAKTILTVHDPELHSGADTLLHRWFDAVNRLRVDGYVVLNESQREAFVSRLHLDPRKAVTIPLGIFDDLLGSARALSEVQSLAQLAALSGRYALFVGRIERYKGIATLLAAYRDFAQAHDVPLVIAGAGEFSAEERDAIAGLGGGSVTVINHWLSDTEIASLVAAARFVVLPYTSATQSGIVPLASAFGVPAIASNTGGLAEQVVDGETGLLFSAGDSVALASALERAFAMDDAQYAQMSARCERYARDNWSWDRLAARLVEFCRSLLDVGADTD